MMTRGRGVLMLQRVRGNDGSTMRSLKRFDRAREFSAPAASAALMRELDTEADTRLHVCHTRNPFERLAKRPALPRQEGIVLFRTALEPPQIRRQFARARESIREDRAVGGRTEVHDI